MSLSNRCIERQTFLILSTKTMWQFVLGVTNLSKRWSGTAVVRQRRHCSVARGTDKHRNNADYTPRCQLNTLVTQANVVASGAHYGDYRLKTGRDRFPRSFVSLFLIYSFLINSLKFVLIVCKSCHHGGFGCISGSFA